MPDSKGELKRYATQYKIETGQHWFVNPVCHGERGFAADDFLYWLIIALSTAEQRIEELQASLDLCNSDKLLSALADMRERLSKQYPKARDEMIAFPDCVANLGVNEIDRLTAALSKAEATIAELRGIMEANDEAYDGMCNVARDLRLEVDALRAERDKELREALVFGRDWDKHCTIDETYFSDEQVFQDFLAQKEGK